MKKRQLNLPAGHHDAESASQLLGVSKLALLKTLREIGFLEIDKRNGLRGRHNLPRKHIKELGWAYEKSLSYGSGPGKKFDHEYTIVIFTQDGFREVKKIIADPTSYRMPEAHQAPRPAQEPIKSRYQRARPNSPSREASLRDLKNLGLDINTP